MTTKRAPAWVEETSIRYLCLSFQPIASQSHGPPDERKHRSTPYTVLIISDTRDTHQVPFGCAARSAALWLRWRVAGRQPPRRRCAPLVHRATGRLHISEAKGGPCLSKPAFQAAAAAMGRFDDWEPVQEVQGRDPVDLRGAARGPKGYKVNPIKTSRKRKLEDQQDSVLEGQPEAMDADGSGAAVVEAEIAPKRQRVEGEPYRTVSGDMQRGCREALSALFMLVMPLRVVCTTPGQRHARTSTQEVPGRHERASAPVLRGPVPPALTPQLPCHGGAQVSGKAWKGPGTKAGSYKSAIVGTTWEKKMAAKAVKKQLAEQKAVAVESARAKRKVRAFCSLDGAACDCIWRRLPLRCTPGEVAASEVKSVPSRFLSCQSCWQQTQPPSSTHLAAPLQAAAQQRASAKERKKANQARSVVVQKVWAPCSYTRLWPRLTYLGPVGSAPLQTRLAQIRSDQSRNQTLAPSPSPIHVHPQITNSATVKKMMKSKKQRKLLKTADTN